MNDSVSTPRTPPGRGPHRGLWLLMAVVTWLAIEFLAGGALWVLARQRGLRYEPTPITALQPRHVAFLEAEISGRRKGLLTLDAQLGWAPRPGAVAGTHRINQQGLRNDRVFPHSHDDDPTRIATFGDSFTFGDDVANVDTFQEVMMRFEPDVEVLNFGIPGSGLGQALLRYRRDGRTFRPDIVVIGYLSENKNRVVNTFRPFYFPRTGLPFAKPRFVVRDGLLTLVENPLPTGDAYRTLLDAPVAGLERLGQTDYWFIHSMHAGRLDVLPSARLAKVVRHKVIANARSVRHGYDTASEPYQVTEKLFDTFYGEVLADNREPVILLFPTRRDLKVWRQKQIKIYQPLLDHFDARALRYVDLLDCLETHNAAVPIVDLVPAHFTPLANRTAALCLLEALRDQDLLPPADDAPAHQTAQDLARRRAAMIAHIRAQPSFRDVPVPERQRIVHEIKAAFGAKIAARTTLEPAS